MSNSAMVTASPWSPITQQRMFRGLLEAHSYPGRVVALECSDADGLCLLLATLVDAETTLADPHGLVDADDRQRLGARPSGPEAAHFVVVRGDLAPEFEPHLGSLESPEAGATVILQVANLHDGQPLRLSGPGIKTITEMPVRGLDRAWLTRREQWNAAFPMGVDYLLFDGSGLVALPRTTRIEFDGEA